MPKKAAELGRRCIRADWMFSAVRECQLFAGAIAFSDGRPIDIKTALGAAIPPPASQLERFILESLIARSLREIENRSSPLHLSLRSNEDLAARAVGILRDRCAEPWTIRRLARELGTNRFRLTTEFRTALGQGVHEYLVECRVDAAQRHINTGEKIEVTAYAVGFRSKKTLYAAFKRVRGRLPKSDPR